MKLTDHTHAREPTSLDLRNFCRAPGSIATGGCTGGECRRLLAGLVAVTGSRGLFLVVDSWCGEPVLLPGTLAKTYLHAPAGHVSYRCYHAVRNVTSLANPRSVHLPILLEIVEMLSGKCSAQAAAHCTIFSGSSVIAASLMQSPSLRGLEEPLGTRSEFTQVPLVLLSSRYHWCGSCRSELYQQS